MANHRKKSELNDAQEKKNTTDNFFVKELKERAEIRQKSKIFKSIIDSEKAAELHRIDSESKLREERISSDISALDTALNGDDTEMIKAALKNFNL